MLENMKPKYCLIAFCAFRSISDIIRKTDAEPVAAQLRLFLIFRIRTLAQHLIYPDIYYQSVF